jgi:Ras family protein T1
VELRHLKKFAQVCTDMGVEAPFTVSMKLGDIGNLFQRIVDAAQQPNLSVPETEAGKSNKNYQRLVQRSLTIAAVGATVSVAGIVLYRVYHARKQQSGS